LKPDVSHSDGGQNVETGICTSALRTSRTTGCMQMLLPCENDQAKLDLFSRLACSTNLSKIL
jgi:hypothetical protein